MNCFIHFELSKTKTNNTDFRTGKPQYGPRLDWSRDEFCQSLYENPGPKHVLFVSKTIIHCIVCIQILSLLWDKTDLKVGLFITSYMRT